MKVNIKKDKQKGFIEYNEKSKSIVVFFPDKAVVKEVEKHLTTKRDFKIPESQEIDDYRIDHVAAVENKTYFSLGMSDLFAATNVFVEG